MSTENYIIREARSNEQPTLVEFILNHFVPRSEISGRFDSNNQHKINEEERKIIAEDRKNKYANALSHNICYVAFHNDSNSIVGMILMSVIKKPKIDKITENHNVIVEQSKIFANYQKYVLDPLNQSADVFAEFPKLEAALKVRLLCVDANHSGQGIATKLIQEAVKYAKDNGIELVYGLFSSPFSQKAAKKNGFQSLSNVNLMDLCDDDGNKMYSDADSHVVSIMAKSVKPIFIN